MQFVAPVAGTEADAWAMLTAALALTEMRVGLCSTAAAGAAALSGVVENFSTEPCDALLRLDAPGPGVAALGACNVGGQSMAALSFFDYGDQAAEMAVAKHNYGRQGSSNGSRCRQHRGRAGDMIVVTACP